MKLYTFWRSLATYRVRIALNLKGITPETVSVDILTGEQHQDEFRRVNPQRMIPALADGEGPVLFQSLAIMEYLDETHPQPPLLPRDPKGRARVRGLAGIIASDSHPLFVPRVRAYLGSAFGLDDDKRSQWARHWIGEGLAAFETIVARDGETGRYCHGDAVSIADICLVSQAAAAMFFQCDMAPYPTVNRIVEACVAQDEFARAHPLRQPGAPASPPR